MAHARAWVSQEFPGALSLEAGARLSRFPDKFRPGEWITHTVREDLFGVLDLAVFPPATGPPFLENYGVQFIQVTTITDGEMTAVHKRMEKVGFWVRAHYPRNQPDWLGAIFVVGWVPRTHLRIWQWSWEQVSATRYGTWKEQEPHLAKLPKVERSAAAPKALASVLSNPFD